MDHSSVNRTIRTPVYSRERGGTLAGRLHLFSARSRPTRRRRRRSLSSLKATDFEMIDGGPRFTWSDYKYQRTPVTN
jgi:hypothetical protein